MATDTSRPGLGALIVRALAHPARAHRHEDRQRHADDRRASATGGLAAMTVYLPRHKAALAHNVPMGHIIVGPSLAEPTFPPKLGRRRNINPLRPRLASPIL